MDDWSESCGFTGLEIREGEKARVMLLDPDYCETNSPCGCYGIVSPPLAVIYDGKGGGYAPLSTPDELAAYQMFCNMTNARERDDGWVTNATVRSDHFIWFMTEDTFKFLPDLPCQDTTRGETLGQRLHAYDKLVREAITPYTASEVSDREANSSDADDEWETVRENEEECPGLQMINRNTGDSFYEGDALTEALFQAEHDTRLVWHAMRETRRMFVPSTQVGLQYEGHKAVSELARFTRRKAIAAGFAAG